MSRASELFSYVTFVSFHTLHDAMEPSRVSRYDGIG